MTATEIMLLDNMSGLAHPSQHGEAALTPILWGLSAMVQWPSPCPGSLFLLMVLSECA